EHILVGFQPGITRDLSGRRVAAVGEGDKSTRSDADIVVHPGGCFQLGRAVVVAATDGEEGEASAIPAHLNAHFTTAVIEGIDGDSQTIVTTLFRCEPGAHVLAGVEADAVSATDSIQPGL